MFVLCACGLFGAGFANHSCVKSNLSLAAPFEITAYERFCFGRKNDVMRWSCFWVLGLLFKPNLPTTAKIAILVCGRPRTAMYVLPSEEDLMNPECRTCKRNL